MVGPGQVLEEPVAVAESVGGNEVLLLGIGKSFELIVDVAQSQSQFRPACLS
jgi:hypothetical protein